MSTTTKQKMIETLDNLTDAHMTELATTARKKMFKQTMTDLEKIYSHAEIRLPSHRYLEGKEIKKDKIEGKEQMYYSYPQYTATKIAEELKQKDDYLIKKGALTGIAYATLKQLSEKDFDTYSQKKYLRYAAYCSIVSGSLEDQATKYLFKKIAEKKPELIPEITSIVKQYYK